MAKIRYLIDNDPYLSMRAAIISEAIVYGRWKRRFIELWGRLWSGSYDDIFDPSAAENTVDGIEVYGGYRVYLFQDGAAEYVYTKEFCELIGADYDNLYNHRYDVEKFYVDLRPAFTTDFAVAQNVADAMAGVRSALEAIDIDRLELKWVLDTQYDTTATAGMDLAALRSATSAQVDYDTGDYTAAAVSLGLLPMLTAFSLPSLAFPDGEAVVLDADMERLLTLFLQYTDHFDPVFNVVSVTDEILDDRVDSDFNVQHRYRYTVILDFDSTMDGSGAIADRIDWSYLTSNTFADSFSLAMEETKTYLGDNLVCFSNIRSQTNYCVLNTQAPATVVAHSVIAARLNTYSAQALLFYVEPSSAAFISWGRAWLRREVIDGFAARLFDESIIPALTLGYREKEGGWLGGSDFGHFLEAIFIIATVVVSVVISVLTANPLPLAIGSAVLAVAARWGGMSASASTFAAGGARVLAIAAAVYGVYDIYNSAYNITMEQAAQEATEAALEQGYGEAEALVIGDLAAESVTTLQVLDTVGVVGTLQVAGNLYKAFNLFLPPSAPQSSQDDSAKTTEEPSGVFSIHTSYDFYDDVYAIY